jgi:hypothetical protein
MDKEKRKKGDGDPKSEKNKAKTFQNRLENIIMKDSNNKQSFELTQTQDIISLLIIWSPFTS